MFVPKHIAIIMDGNGRWAKKRALGRSLGHIAGAKAIKPVVLHCKALGVEILTLFAMSTENWKRPKAEVKGLVKLINYYIKNMDRYLKYGVRIKFFGDLNIFSSSMRDNIKKVEEKFSVNKGMTFAIALNYGGKDEIKNAVREIAFKVKNGEITPEEISEDIVANHLYTRGFPNVDLLIRPGGEFRLSNFMLWQCAYSEFVFIKNLFWPDFKPKHIDMAIEEYRKRNRRYGNVYEGELYEN